MGVKTEINAGSSLLTTITGKPYWVKYFNLKDIDPKGLLKKQIKKLTPKTTSTGFIFENPIRPPDPQLSPWVKVVGNEFHG